MREVLFKGFDKHGSGLRFIRLDFARRRRIRHADYVNGCSTRTSRKLPRHIRHPGLEYPYSKTQNTKYDGNEQST
jgi:hypothetical protein